MKRTAQEFDSKIILNLFVVRPQSDVAILLRGRNSVDTRTKLLAQRRVQ